MTWQVLIHPLVFEEDFRKIDPTSRQRIVKTIRKKLTGNPEEFGDPLRGEFHGYWKLRVGEYRVVYKIEKDRIVVKVIKVGIRRDFEVYDDLIRRIPQILDF